MVEGVFQHSASARPSPEVPVRLRFATLAILTLVQAPTIVANAWHNRPGHLDWSVANDGHIHRSHQTQTAFP